MFFDIKKILLKKYIYFSFKNIRGRDCAPLTIAPSAAAPAAFFKKKSNF